MKRILMKLEVGSVMIASSRYWLARVSLVVTNERIENERNTSATDSVPSERC
jgi:hypothetical protein